MLNKQDKIFEVENLKAKIKDAKAVALVDYKGTTMLQLNQLRDKVKTAGGELQVVKNSLFERSLRSLGFKPEEIQGPSLALFANEDEVAPIKALVTYAKNLGELLSLKVGFMGDQTLSAEELKRFASLPAKIELQAKLVGLLASPPTRLVYALNWNIQKLVLVLETVKGKKQ